MTTKIDNLITMKWGRYEDLVCTGKQGEGVILADCGTSLGLTSDESEKVAAHIVNAVNNHEALLDVCKAVIMEGESVFGDISGGLMRKAKLAIAATEGQGQ